MEPLEERALLAVVDFLAAETFSSGGSGPRAIAVGDFNNDGIDDLAAANNTSVTVLLGDASGNLTAVGTYFTAGRPASLAVGDFNNDGNYDLAAANSDTNRIGLLLGDGTGGFGAPSIVLSGGLTPFAVAVADFNGDDQSDLAVANLQSGSVAIALGNGDGSFAAVEVFTSGGFGARALAVSDFNGDGRPDLAVGQNASVAVLLGDGSGGLGTPNLVSTGSFSSITSVAVGDFNNDGQMDLAAANTFVGEGVALLTGDGAGGFASVAAYFTGGTGTRTVTVGDFNSDGNADLAVANSANGTVGVLLGTGGNAFAPAINFGSGGATPFGIVARDFNGDGQLDLAVANLGSQTVGLLFNSTVIAFEDVARQIENLAVSHADPAAVLTVTVVVQNGTLYVDPLATTVEISGNASALVTLVGTQAEINATLAAGVVYLGNANFSGGETLTMKTTDGAGLSDIDYVQIQVLSAQQQADALASFIADLGDDGVLNSGQESSLLKILGLVTTVDSEGPLEALLRRIAALVDSGTLTQEQADELTASAETLVLSLQ